MDARLQHALSGRYIVERELGAGATATVWLARDLKHDRQVAIKVLHPQLAAVVGAERFLKEIRTTAQVQHPHILPLFDSGDVDGQLYYVMPFVDGESLRQRLVREGQLPVGDAVRITMEICSALDYSHRHGIIHRDIKPENILLHDGLAIVADFGIAYSKGTGEHRLTETGLSVGTPAYMSPEQALGDRTVDARSDIYAVGTLLYEMLTGAPPFVGPSSQAIVAKVITHAPVPPSKVRRGIPAHVDDSVLTALQKDPAQRFPTAAAMQASLEGTGAALRPARRRRPRVIVAVAALAGLASLAGVAYVARHRLLVANDVPSLSIAALPFEIQDSADAYLGDQMPQEILDALTRVPGLTVRPLASAPRFRRERDLATIGNALQVGTLLTGSVRREGRSIRITARLYDVMRNVSLGSVAFTNSADNKFALEDSVSQSIVSDFRLTQSSEQLAVSHARRTSNPAAHDTLMLARWYAEQRTPEGLTNAITLFREAIRLDSTYADAWAGLASALNLRGVFGDSAPARFFAEAKVDVIRALALDSNSAYAHTQYGFTKAFYDRDYVAAKAQFAEAIRLDSMQSAAWLFQGWAYLGSNQIDSAILSVRHGWGVDPGSLIVGTRVGTMLYFADSLAAAERQLDVVLKMDKNYHFARTEMSALYSLENHCDKAVALLPTILLPLASGEDVIRATVWARCNEREKTKAYLEMVEARAQNRQAVSGFFVAQVYGILGDTTNMYRWLDKSIETNEWALFELRFTPAFRPYRSTQRFQALLRKARV
ncbi:MAG: protein kinase [Gemmatimonadota bacterium]|nr:protein kinase [Gemmatimonadota bacterium]